MWWWISVALAAPCPDLTVEVERAWLAYDDAEVAMAREIIAGAYTGLDCQSAPVTTQTLLDLYWFDGLLALTRDDVKGATYAVIRAIAASPEQPPTDRYGAALSAMWHTWAARLAQQSTSLRVDGGGEVWVDGRRYTQASPSTVVLGEHVVQVPFGGSFRTEVRDVVAPLVVSTGLPVTALADDRPGPADRPSDAPLSDPPLSDPPLSDARPVAPSSGSSTAAGARERGRTRSPAVLGLAGGLVIAGAGTTTWGFVQEQRTLSANYYPPSIGGCALGDDCYAALRADLIRSDARLIRGLYGVGYGLIGVGAVLGAVGLIGKPAKPKAAARVSVGPAGVALSGGW